MNGWIAAAAAGYQRIWGTPHAHYSAPKPFSAPQTFLQTKPRSYLGHIEPVAEQKIGPNLISCQNLEIFLASFWPNLIRDCL